MKHFVKNSVLNDASTMIKLAEVDVFKKENIVPAKNVVTGFAVKRQVDSAKRKPSVHCNF